MALIYNSFGVIGLKLLNFSCAGAVMTLLALGLAINPSRDSGAIRGAGGRGARVDSADPISATAFRLCAVRGVDRDARA